MSETDVLDGIDPRVLRDCCGRFATGVTVITARTPAGDHGMTVSAFMSVSLDPALICVAVGNRARMLSKIRATGRFAVNILSEHMRAHALHFAGRTDEALTDLFEDACGLPVIRGAGAVFVTDLVQRIPAGDHNLLIGQVRHLWHDPLARPLLWHGGQFGSLAA